MVRIFTVSAVLMAIWAQPAAAQNVPGTQEAIQNFVASFATPTRMTGKIARWEDGVCPRTVGQRPAIAQIVTQRVKDLAAFAGAPVNDSPSCTPNIEIVFTASPQALLDDVRAHQPDYIGYAEGGAQMEKLATVTRPLQAWYTTQTRDLHGLNRIDSARRPGEGVAMPCFTCNGGRGPSGPTEYLSDATFAHVTGSRVTDGVRSVFYHILIVTDPSKLQDHGIGPLADYIAMLALTQINSQDSCRPLPSIVNMLAKDCATKTDMLTKNDATYLRGLYRMSADRKFLATEKSEIADSMEAGLNGR
jgi:hypothetical protein